MTVSELFDYCHLRLRQALADVEHACKYGGETDLPALLHEFRVHRRAEEDLLYPAMAELAGLDGHADEGRNDHESLQALAERLLDEDMRRETRRRYLGELRSAFERHANREENEMFVALQQTVDRQWLERVCQQIMELRSWVDPVGRMTSL